MIVKLRPLFWFGYLLLANPAYADCNSPQKDDVFACIEQKKVQNMQLIDRITLLFEEKKINTFAHEWHEYVRLKCDWVEKNKDISLYGDEDNFSAGICWITEQNSRINELLYLFDLNIINNKNLDKEGELLAYLPKEKVISGNRTTNFYFNFLSQRFSSQFCSHFYVGEEVNSCENRIFNHQFDPEEYGFKIKVERTLLLNKPTLNSKSKMYLIKGDKVNLLQRQNDFYQIEYQSAKKGMLRKWIHCSAIEAC